jgi:hypothetical protein
VQVVGGGLPSDVAGTHGRVYGLVVPDCIEEAGDGSVLIRIGV